MGWVLLLNGDSGVDTWCPAKKAMAQIMFYNQLATFGPFYKSAISSQVDPFHNGMGLLWNRDSGADTWCSAMEPMSKIMFFNHLTSFGTIYKSAEGPQVGLFHNWMGPIVKRGQWCRHLVSDHDTNGSSHVLESFGSFWHHLQVSHKSTSGPVPQRDGSCCETGTVVRTPGVRPWNQSLKSCFLIIWQLLAQLSSQP